MTADELLPPLIHAQRGPLPVLLSVPHSGRDYPAWLIDMARSGRSSLEALEDRLVDRMVWRALAAGCGAVIARAPRAAVDCNRAEEECDPAVIDGARQAGISARARGGLGIVPARTRDHGYLWRRSISTVQLEERLAVAYRPYHSAIERELTAIRRRFGCALLLDCHSMPPPKPGVTRIVIGDAHGRSARHWLSQQALEICQANGIAAGLNDPFAGGHILARHGHPGADVHALQLEVDRSLYLDRALKQPGPGFDRVAELIESLARGLGETLAERANPTATAAE